MTKTTSPARTVSWLGSKRTMMGVCGMCKASATPSAIIYACAFGAGGGRSGWFTGVPGGGPFGGGPFGGGPFGGGPWWGPWWGLVATSASSGGPFTGLGGGGPFGGPWGASWATHSPSQITPQHRSGPQMECRKLLVYDDCYAFCEI